MDEELVQLPWEYAPPKGRLILAYWDEAAAGCIALRPLGPLRCEMRRLYVRPTFRSTGIGRQLVHQLVQDARSLGYHQMMLTTLPAMAHALRLYRDMGFCEVEPYAGAAQVGVIYMSLAL